MDKKKILKIILALVVLLILIITIHFTRNYIILGKIAKMQEKFANATNFSYIVEDQTYDDKLILTRIYSNGTQAIMKHERENGAISFWDDKSTNEVIIITADNKAIINRSGSPMHFAVPTLTIDEDFRAISALTFFISYDEIDGEKCYVVNWGNAKDYISMENGITLKQINGQVSQNNKKHNIVKVYKNVKIDEVKDNDVERPDLSNYEILEV